MQKLPNYAKALLLQGASTTGNFSDGYFFVQENLQSNHAIELQEFCQWLDKHIGGAGSRNIDMLFSAFKNPLNEELANQANALANKIRQIKSL
jgi:hypothetical protein